ncbi:MAG: DUF3237 domain-containing protein [Myxococcales bacterium]|nr:DUF3237 domain-containing protein [Myxococcales bacterium]
MTLDEVFKVRVGVEAPRTTGKTPGGELRVIAFTDGEFEGSGLRGRLLPGGTDWQCIRDDGSLEIRARYMLETDDGETIQVVSEGLRTASPEVLARLAAGEPVPSDEYYFRTFIRLASGAPRLKHFNDRLYVGVGEREAERVQITVYALP